MELKPILIIFIIAVILKFTISNVIFKLLLLIPIVLIWYRYFYMSVNEYFVLVKISKHTYLLQKKSLKTLWLFLTNESNDILKKLKVSYENALMQSMELVDSGDKIILETHLFSKRDLRKSLLKPEVSEFKQSVFQKAFVALTALLIGLLKKNIFHLKKGNSDPRKIYRRKWYRLTWTKP